MARPQKNNADYFSHDTSMRNHRKIKLVRSRFWNEWFAVFVMMLEVLTDCEGFMMMFEWYEIEMIAQDFMIDQEKLTKIIWFMVEIWLFQKLQSWMIYNQHLIDRMKPLLNKRSLMRSKYEEKEQKQSPPPKPPKNPPPPSTKMTLEQFELFWTKYPKKSWKKKVEEKFLKLDWKMFDVIMKWIDNHSKWKSRQTWFVLNPETFINQERRNDEVPPFNQPKQNATAWKSSEEWTFDFAV